MLVEPLHTSEVKRIILAAINFGFGGSVHEGENENGSWRYRVMTERMVVVVSVRSEAAVVVVTAWKVRS